LPVFILKLSWGNKIVDLHHLREDKPMCNPVVYKYKKIREVLGIVIKGCCEKQPGTLSKSKYL
jgi:hypothetical protein